MNKALEAARLKREEMKEAGVKLERKSPLEKALERPGSLRLAVNGKCWECEGEEDPGVRERIRTCSVVTCPLHSVRPYQK